MKKLVTAEQAVDEAALLDGNGKRLYKETGFVEWRKPVLAFKGAVGHHSALKYVGYNYRGKAVVRRYVVPSDPRTAKQVSRRGLFQFPQKSWKTLSVGQRNAWHEYASRYVPPLPDPEAVRTTPVGMNWFCRAQFYRRAMGYEASFEPPVAPPPGEVLEISVEPASGDTSFAFRITHGEHNTTGMRLLIELTPPSPSLRRKPRENALRWWHDDAAQCFVPLKPSGEVYVLEGACVLVAAGQRFGVRIRIVTEEGIRGPEKMIDFIKP